MEKIKLNEGVYTVKLDNDNEPICWNASFFKDCDLVELHIPNGATTLGDKAFIFCRNLKRIYMPKSVTNLGESLFYGTYTDIDIFYDGTKDEFIEISKSRKELKAVQVPGKYDVQPYNNSSETYYEMRLEPVRPFAFSHSITVHSVDNEVFNV